MPGEDHKPTVGLIFSGAGSAAEGARQAGFRLRYLIDPRDFIKTQTWEHNFPEAEYSVNDLNAFPRMDVDLIIGSPPCSSYSLLNRTKTRLDLYATDPDKVEYTSFMLQIKKRRPRAFILENLPRIRDFLFFPFNPKDACLYVHYYEERTKKFETKEVVRLEGYRVYQYFLDTEAFGLAQRRLRLFIVGIRDDLVWSYEPPKVPASGGAWLNAALKGLSPHHTCHDKEFLKPELKKEWRDLPYGVKTKKKSRKLAPKQPAPTVVSGSLRHFHYKEPRFLTARECARLQGFPDEFWFAGSMRQQLDQVGKAIAVPIAKSLSEAVAISLQSKREFSAIEEMLS